MSTELVKVTPTTNVEAYRASTDAAELCKAIVVRTAKVIQGRKFVPVEGWQAIAVAHGCAASARDVERLPGQGVRCIGEVRRQADGQLISQAEGFVGEDEPVWFGGTKRSWKWGQRRGEKVWFDEEVAKRPDYAIRAMCQTRAISRACRSAFAHVVVMMNEGLQTTPAEEMDVIDAEYTEADAPPPDDFPGDRPASGGAPPPEPTKTANQARKDGDWERGLAEMKRQRNVEELAKWANSFAIFHRWPKPWKDEFMALYNARKKELAQAAAKAAAPPAEPPADGPEPPPMDDLDQQYRDMMR